MMEKSIAAVNLKRVRMPCRGAAIVLCAALVAACSVHQDATWPSRLEQTAARQPGKPDWMASFASTEHARVPLMHLPEAAGRVGEVRQHLYSNGLRQIVRLDSGPKTPLTSGIEVALQASDRRGLDDPLSIEKPTEAGVRSEIGTIFPGLPMRIVTESRANRFGPYGLAVGKSKDGTRCIFAWQWIDRSTASESLRIDAALAWRIHLCSRDATLDQLAGYVDELDLRLEGFPEAEPAKAAGPARRSGRAVAVRHDSDARTAMQTRHPAGVVAPTTGVTAYLAPLPDEPSPRAGVRSAALDSTLPAEAFRGPSSQGLTASAR